MTETPAITIGIMTHNYGRYIKEAIDSVLVQGRADWEMVISDDASTDGTEQIVAPYLSDPRIRYVRHETNLGQAGNWGYLLGQGTAPVLTVLHADDKWVPGALEMTLAAFDADPDLDLFYGNWWLDVAGREGLTLTKNEKPHTFTGRQEYGYQVTRNTWLPSATFMTRRVVQAAGPPNETLKMVVDCEFFLRVAANARLVRAVAEPMTVYRVHARSTTSECAANGRYHAEMEQLPEICAHALPSHAGLQGSIGRLRRSLAKQLFSMGVTEIMKGEREAGQVLMRRGLRLDLSILLQPKVALDWSLCCLGGIGYPVFMRLHTQRRKALEAAA